MVTHNCLKSNQLEQQLVLQVQHHNREGFTLELPWIRALTQLRRAIVTITIILPEPPEVSHQYFREEEPMLIKTQ